MEQRLFERAGWPVSVIGLGTEYLLDRPRATMSAVLDGAVAAGVDYIDVLYNLPRFLADFGPAIRPFRQRVHLGVHWGCGEVRGQSANVRDQAECERYFNATLEATGCDYADVALLMMVDDLPTWTGWAQESLERLMQLRCQGRIGAIGMSTHFSQVAQVAIASGAIYVLMYPVNPAACAGPANQELLAACAAHHVSVVAMKPYAGGVMFGAQAVMVHWYLSGGEFVSAEIARPATPTQCLSFALDQPAVATVVPGVRDLAELESALAYLAASPAERAYDDLLQVAAHFPAFQCVYCNHCLPCPAEIDIAAVLRLLDAVVDGRPSPAQQPPTPPWPPMPPTAWRARLCTALPLRGQRAPTHGRGHAGVRRR
jgi:predicted aldo/keto reductase-like oxidoreductase